MFDGPVRVSQYYLPSRNRRRLLRLPVDRRRQAADLPDRCVRTRIALAIFESISRCTNLLPIRVRPGTLTFQPGEVSPNSTPNSPMDQHGGQLLHHVVRRLPDVDADICVTPAPAPAGTFTDAAVPVRLSRPGLPVGMFYRQDRVHLRGFTVPDDAEIVLSTATDIRFRHRGRIMVVERLRRAVRRPVLKRDWSLEDLARRCRPGMPVLDCSATTVRYCGCASGS